MTSPQVTQRNRQTALLHLVQSANRLSKPVWHRPTAAAAAAATAAAAAAATAATAAGTACDAADGVLAPRATADDEDGAAEDGHAPEIDLSLVRVLAVGCDLFVDEVLQSAAAYAMAKRHQKQHPSALHQKKQQQQQQQTLLQWLQQPAVISVSEVDLCLQRLWGENALLALQEEQQQQQQQQQQLMPEEGQQLAALSETNSSLLQEQQSSRRCSVSAADSGEQAAPECAATAEAGAADEATDEMELLDALFSDPGAAAEDSIAVADSSSAAERHQLSLQQDLGKTPIPSVLAPFGELPDSSARYPARTGDEELQRLLQEASSLASSVAQQFVQLQSSAASGNESRQTAPKTLLDVFDQGLYDS
ncbi:protein elav-like [Cyclospora cayetanensis]|uniref:Protein elav-like n=1 Tax=Cyclospora cayetanensis TaxID=88456 RepID=A0A6P6RUM6_9EIME|nr:protein elav-like [Cyclospora cayetanensis]